MITKAWQGFKTILKQATCLRGGGFDLSLGLSDIDIKNYILVGDSIGL